MEDRLKTAKQINTDAGVVGEYVIYTQKIIDKAFDKVVLTVMRDIAQELKAITENNGLTDEEKVGHIRRFADNLKQGRVE